MNLQKEKTRFYYHFLKSQSKKRLSNCAVVVWLKIEVVTRGFINRYIRVLYIFLAFKVDFYIFITSLYTHEWPVITSFFSLCKKTLIIFLSNIYRALIFVSFINFKQNQILTTSKHLEITIINSLVTQVLFSLIILVVLFIHHLVLKILLRSYYFRSMKGKFHTQLKRNW